MKFFLIASCCMMAAVLHAQPALDGYVTDSEDKPIPNATVQMLEHQRSAFTDALGYYSFTSVPGAKVTVGVSAHGYESQELPIDLRHVRSFNFKLASKAHTLDEIIVSTPFNRLQSQNVVKVEHVAIGTLDQNGSISLIEGLASIPGISQISTGTGIGKPVIRGLSGNRVVVYAQGVRMENQQFGDEHGLGLSETGLASVEVIKGPASLLYGSDAMGGVLYFNPEKFTEAGSVNAAFGTKYFSNTEGTQISAGVKAASAKWKINTGFGHTVHSDYKVPDGLLVTNTRYNDRDFKAAIGFAENQYVGALRFHINSLAIGIPDEGIGAQSDVKAVRYPKQEIVSRVLSMQNDFLWGASKFEADFGLQQNNRQEFENPGQPTLSMELSTLSYDFRYNFTVAKQLQSVSGIQGMYQQNRNYGEEQLIPDADINDFGIFSTVIYDLNPVSVQGGIRWDNRAINFNSPEPDVDANIMKAYHNFTGSIGLKLQAASSITWRFNIAGGFRSPNLAELASNGVHEGTNRYEIGNTALVSERNLQFDANAEYKTEHLDISINGFHNSINNYIYPAPAGGFIDGHAVFKYIQSPSTLYGGEVGIHFHPHPLDWLHIESSFETVTGRKKQGGFLPLIPANNWNNTFRVEFRHSTWLTRGFARVNVIHTFAQNRIGQFETESSYYNLVNVGAGGSIKLRPRAFNLQFNLNNIFNQQYIPHLSRLKADAVPNIGRNLILSVDFTI